MAQRSLSRMEQIGIYALIIMAGVTIYTRFIYPGAGRKFDRIKKETAKIQAQVASLEQELDSGRTDRKIRKLKKDLGKAKAALKEAETHLATDEEKDSLSARIIQVAGAQGLMIRNFSRITDQAVIRQLTGRDDPLQTACYRINLDGTFNRVVAFLKHIDQMDKMITMQRLHMGMSEKDTGIQMEVWVTL